MFAACPRLDVCVEGGRRPIIPDGSSTSSHQQSASWRPLHTGLIKFPQWSVARPFIKASSTSKPVAIYIYAVWAVWSFNQWDRFVSGPVSGGEPSSQVAVAMVMCLWVLSMWSWSPYISPPSPVSLLFDLLVRSCIDSECVLVPHTLVDSMWSCFCHRL